MIAWITSLVPTFSGPSFFSSTRTVGISASKRLPPQLGIYLKLFHSYQPPIVWYPSTVFTLRSCGVSDCQGVSGGGVGVSCNEGFLVARAVAVAMEQPIGGSVGNRPLPQSAL